MKKIQQLCLATVFTLVLITPAFAGEIGTGGKSEPPPPPTSASTTTSSEVPLAPKDDGEYEYQLIEDIALELLQTMLSVF
jgi:hypothetical protein